jgi:predicted transcriptional regulator
MTAKQLLTYSLPTLKPEDTPQLALKLMDEYKVSHLPLVANGKYVNLIKEASLLELVDCSTQLQNLNLPVFKPFALENHSIFDILLTFDKTKTSVLPVIDKNENYIGSILSHELLFKTISIFNLNQPGAVITFRIRKIDYSITQIGNIIEANNAKILSFFVIPDSQDYIKLILKLNTPDVVSILQTFERYDYEVDSVLYDDEKYKELYQKSLDTLLNYLSI